jgi:nucleotide-binding universal stress UspA family protein
MVKKIKNILFASDLSVNMAGVFEQAVGLAVSQDANIIVLHAMERSPQSQKQIQLAFGKELYENLKSEQISGARNILIGKNVDALRIRKAIAGFFKDDKSANEASEGDSMISKILVAEGRSIADEITATASEENCDMIVMGCKQQGLLAEAMGNNLVRKILKRSSVPVFIVPFKE